jgi:hypothetical protein
LEADELAFNAMLLVEQVSSGFTGLLVRRGLAGAVVFCVTLDEADAVHPLEELVAVTV